MHVRKAPRTLYKTLSNVCTVIPGSHQFLIWYDLTNTLLPTSNCEYIATFSVDIYLSGVENRPGAFLKHDLSL